MSIKYYRLAKDEEPPEEFCAVRDVGGEPSEYVFYVPERENAKLQGLVLTLAFCANDEADCDQCPMNGAHCDAVQQCFCDGATTALRELGIEVNE